MRFLRSRKDVRDGDLPFRVYGSTLCSRCTDVKKQLGEAGIRFEAIPLVPGDVGRSSFGDRGLRATLLAALTWQNELLPLIVTADGEGFLPQDRVERFLA